MQADHSNNPNGGLGILGNCKSGSLFLEGTWNSAICDVMKPQEGDLVVKGKTGLDAFPGSDLEEILVTNNIETVALGIGTGLSIMTFLGVWLTLT